MDQKTHDKGLEIRKAVLGEAYVANALKNADDFKRVLQQVNRPKEDRYAVEGVNIQYNLQVFPSMFGAPNNWN